MIVWPVINISLYHRSSRREQSVEPLGGIKNGSYFLTVFGIYVAKSRNSSWLEKHMKYVAFTDTIEAFLLRWKAISREVNVKVIRLRLLPCP